MADPTIPPPPPGFTIDAAMPAPTPAPAAPQGPVTLGTPQPKVPTAPTGYRFTQGGQSLEPIPGGPADPQKDQPQAGVSPVSGDAYLKTLDQGTAALVKALATGRKAFPSGSALRSPYWQDMLTRVSNYDPGFDEVNYTSRSATRRDFTSGKAANNIRALNTAIGHLGHLAEQIDGTASHSLVPLNAVENTVLRATGDPGPTNFDATVSALAGELTAVYRGAGGAEADIQRYIQQLNPNASQAQKLGTIRNIIGLLESRLNALNDQYRQGMGTTAQPLQLLDPQSQLIVHKLGGFDASGTPENPQGKPPPPPPSNDGGPTPPMGPSANGFNETPDPQSAQFWESAARQGMPYTRALVLWQRNLKARGQQPTTPPPPDAYSKVVDFIRRNPNVEYHPFSGVERTPVSATDQAVTNAAFSTPGAFTLNAANGLTAGIPSAVAGDQGKYFETVSQNQHPVASTLGDLAGSTVGMLGGEAGLARLGMKAGLGRELVANSLYGAARGGAENPDNRIGGAIGGGFAGAAGTLGGNALVRGLSGVFRGVTNPEVNALFGMNIPLTVGQAAGGKLKAVEDKLTSVPLVGDVINARRAEGVRQFNSAAFNQALKPVDGNVGNAVGEEAVSKAYQQVGQAFSDALKGKTAVPDDKFIAQARGPLERLAGNKRVGPEIVNEVEQATSGLFDEQTGTISGENMQAFLGALRQIRQGYRNDPLYQSLIKPSIQGIENAVEGMFQRQAPEVIPKFNAAKAAYRRLSTLADAVNRGKNTEGVFTPGQLGLADRANAKKFDGPMAAASGNSPFFDLQRAAQNVLPNRVPDSGTPSRLLLAAAPGLIASSGAGLGYAAGDTRAGSGIGLGLAGVLAALYTKRGQQALVGALIKRLAAARAAGTALRRAAPTAGRIGAASAQESSRAP